MDCINNGNYWGFEPPIVSNSAARDKMLNMINWNVVTLSSSDIGVDICPVCKIGLNEKCMYCVVNADNVAKDKCKCTTDVRGQSYHEHCLNG
ncbi:RING-box protein 1-like [Teleopsis dalmanni]|uniref:RING-box protein 1-like n=1 Tax=Teleopsis dalmanni TaxID=139649 RepID=UPI000D329D14|nr:RING-box protein 1-like [Teleopsis dalmanni]